ncbi:MAG TPA: Clp protease N-terminal domain-containing protein, partial [Hyphomonas sp.]|nr:Clp protease N-terminal domain-containing protein [Hyphomonas sp.]
MNIEQYTERARGLIQTAQTLALAGGHQVLTPAHILKTLLEDRDQLAVNLIRASGGRPELAVQAAETALAKQPKVSGAGAGGLRLEQAGAKLFQDAEAGAKKAGDAYVTAERLLLAIAGLAGDPAAEALKVAGVTAKALEGAIAQLRQGRTADSQNAE